MSTEVTRDELPAVVLPEWTFADRLRKARQTIGLDQRSFAERLDVKSGAYAQWEAGNSRPRDIVTIAKRIQLITRVPATWLLDVDLAPRGGNGGTLVGGGIRRPLVGRAGLDPATSTV